MMRGDNVDRKDMDGLLWVNGGQRRNTETDVRPSGCSDMRFVARHVREASKAREVRVTFQFVYYSSAKCQQVTASPRSLCCCCTYT